MLNNKYFYIDRKNTCLKQNINKNVNIRTFYLVSNSLLWDKGSISVALTHIFLWYISKTTNFSNNRLLRRIFIRHCILKYFHSCNMTKPQSKIIFRIFPTSFLQLLGTWKWIFISIRDKYNKTMKYY